MLQNRDGCPLVKIACAVPTNNSEAEPQITVVVADDDISTRDAVVDMLDLLGYGAVKTASNGQEALDALKQDIPHVLLLDLMMPVLDGFGVLRELRAYKELRPGRIIVMSAHADPASQAGLQALGADVFLPKPFSLTDLETVMGTVPRP